MSDERNSLPWAGTAATRANETTNARKHNMVRIPPPASLRNKCRDPIEGCVHGSCISNSSPPLAQIPLPRLGERLGEGGNNVRIPLTQPLPQGGEEPDSGVSTRGTSHIPLP